MFLHAYTVLNLALCMLALLCVESNPTPEQNDEQSGSNLRELFSKYNCEKMHECQLYPKTKICGRDLVTGIIPWFENLCTLWKANCMRVGMYFAQNSKMCEDIERSLFAKNRSLFTFTEEIINKPQEAPMEVSMETTLI